MKKLVKTTLPIAALLGLAGCGTSVPDCSDPDVKELVAEIAKDSEQGKVLGEIDQNIQRYKAELQGLEANLKTEITDAELKKWRADIRATTEPIENLNLLVGLSVDNRSSYHFMYPAKKHGWKELDSNWHDATNEFDSYLRRLADFDKSSKQHAEYLLKVNPLLGLPANNRNLDKFIAAVQAKPEDRSFWNNIGQKVRKNLHDRSDAINRFENSLRYIDQNMKRDQPQQALADLQKYNEHIGLPVDNRDIDKFKEAAKTQGWRDTEYKNYEDAIMSFERLAKTLERIYALDIADKKRNIEKHNAGINVSIAVVRKKIKDWQAIADYVKGGIFRVQAIRTTGINEQSGKRKCDAQLKFIHPAKTHTIDIEYTVELTDEDEIYINARGIRNVYGL